MKKAIPSTRMGSVVSNKWSVFPSLVVRVTIRVKPKSFTRSKKVSLVGLHVHSGFRVGMPSVQVNLGRLMCPSIQILGCIDS